MHTKGVDKMVQSYYSSDEKGRIATYVDLPESPWHRLHRAFHRSSNSLPLRYTSSWWRTCLKRYLRLALLDRLWLLDATHASFPPSNVQYRPPLRPASCAETAPAASSDSDLVSQPRSGKRNGSKKSKDDSPGSKSGIFSEPPLPSPEPNRQGGNHATPPNRVKR